MEWVRGCPQCGRELRKPMLIEVYRCEGCGWLWGDDVNLNAAVQIYAQDAGISTPQTRTREDIANWIFTLTMNTGRKRTISVSEYSKKWLPSATFRLMQVQLDKVNQPIEPKYPEIAVMKTRPGNIQNTPIVIDLNVSTDWPGATLVIDGKHRVEAWRAMGWKTCPAWVGEQAVGEFA